METSTKHAHTKNDECCVYVDVVIFGCKTTVIIYSVFCLFVVYNGVNMVDGRRLVECF